jgi:glycosyltransferase involved in cell wall biosynthesis
MSEGLKICFVCSEYPPAQSGGIGTMTRVMGRALVARGHKVTVIGSYPNQKEAVVEDNDEGVRVIRLARPSGMASWVRERMLTYRQIATLCRTEGLDVVEVPDFGGSAAYWPKLDAPVVARLHGSSCYFAAEMGRQPDRTSFWLERASLQRADFVCSTSRYTADKTGQLFGLEAPRQEHVMYNPVEVPGAPAPAGDRARWEVVYTGTLVEKKGVISLLKSWAGVVRAQPKAQLHLFGKDGRSPEGGSMRQYLESIAGEQAGKSVFFHGHVTREQVIGVLRRARVAVFPSYAEAFAIAPLEAMAQGCPTIYTTRGSGLELITSGDDGLLVDPDNHGQLSEAISNVLASDDLAARLGSSGRLRVERSFALPVILKRNEEFFHYCQERHSRN